MPPDGTDIKAITLTRDHKAIYPQERARIEKSGGFVSKDGRLGGRIEVSRAFGDPLYKDAGMSAVPDMKVWPHLTSACLLYPVVLQSIGLWVGYTL